MHKIFQSLFDFLWVLFYVIDLWYLQRTQNPAALFLQVMIVVLSFTLCHLRNCAFIYTLCFIQFQNYMLCLYWLYCRKVTSFAWIRIWFIFNHELTQFLVLLGFWWWQVDFLLDFAKELWYTFVKVMTLFGLFLRYIFVRWMNTSMHQQLTIVKLSLEIHKVPVLNEMSCQIMNTSTLNFDANIMPRHSGLRLFVDVRHLKLPRSVNITEPEVTKVSSFPQFFIFGWFIFNNFVLLCIPSAITKI